MRVFLTVLTVLPWGAFKDFRLIFWHYFVTKTDHFKTIKSLYDQKLGSHIETPECLHTRAECGVRNR